MERISSNSKNQTAHWLTIGSILFLSLVGSLSILYATKWGPWVFSDSTEYIYSARNLLSGRGLGLYGPTGNFHPSVLHPPFYTLVISFFGLFGANLLSVTRWLDVILFGLTILLTGLSIYYLTSSHWLPIVSCLLLLTMPSLVDVYSGVMSEPLFIFTALASLFSILVFLRNQRTIFLIIAGISAGLSLLTRYSGIGVILAGVVILLVFDQGSWKRKLVHVLTYGFLSGIATLGWLIWVQLQSRDVRELMVGTSLREEFNQFRLSVLRTIWSWLPYPSLLPSYSYNLVRNVLICLIPLVLVLISLAIVKSRKYYYLRDEGREGLALTLLMAFLAIGSIIVLALSYLFTFPTPDINPRTLLPVQIAVLLGMFSLFYLLIKLWRLPAWVNIFPIFLALAITFSYLTNSLKTVALYHDNGSGYTSVSNRNSQLIQSVKKLPATTPLISNESALVLFYTGRPAYDITEIIDAQPQQVTDQYGSNLSDPPQKAFREDGAALVLFPSSHNQFENLYGSDADKRLDYLTKGLTIFTQTSDGAIYFYPPAGP